MNWNKLIGKAMGWAWILIFVLFTAWLIKWLAVRLF
jgi:hypothetical protein